MSLQLSKHSLVVFTGASAVLLRDAGIYRLLTGNQSLDESVGQVLV